MPAQPRLASGPSEELLLASRFGLDVRSQKIEDFVMQSVVVGAEAIEHLLKRHSRLTNFPGRGPREEEVGIVHVAFVDFDDPLIVMFIGPPR